MIIPAIKGKMGEWIYYTANMSMTDIASNVKQIDKELHRSNTLSEMLQRSLTENYKNIASYLLEQDERFFNSLVLAIYDGDPSWQEVRLDFDDENEYYDLGFLELTGDEKIFPIDGQHRVEGIKHALLDRPELAEEQVPVIFIGHSKSEEGMQRSRRLFSTLNRYAKPVTLNDIIALDEDDTIAIVTRILLENYGLFSNGRVLVSNQKAIPKSNTTAFTSIITFYECNRLIGETLLSEMVLYDVYGNEIKKRKEKLDTFLKYRQEEGVIEQFLNEITQYWDCLREQFSIIDEIHIDHDKSIEIGRNDSGGNLLFRPIGISQFTRAAIKIAKKKKIGICDVVRSLSEIDFNMSSRLWTNIVWDVHNRTMITNNQTVLQNIIIYLYDKKLLSDKQRSSLINKLITLYGFETEGKVKSHLKQYLL